jgi:hypothetical protein
MSAITPILSFISPILSVATGIMSLTAQSQAASYDATAYQLQSQAALQQGESEAQAAEYNAQKAREEASIVSSQTEADKERARRENLVRSGALRAGTTGNLTGSSLDLLASNVAQQELDILNIENQGYLERRSLLNSANLYDMSAASSRQSAANTSRGSSIASSSAILSGKSNYYSGLGKVASSTGGLL